MRKIIRLAAVVACSSVVAGCWLDSDEGGQAGMDGNENLDGYITEESCKAFIDEAIDELNKKNAEDDFIAGFDLIPNSSALAKGQVFEVTSDFHTCLSAGLDANFFKNTDGSYSSMQDRVNVAQNICGLYEVVNAGWPYNGFVLVHGNLSSTLDFKVDPNLNVGIGNTKNETIVKPEFGVSVFIPDDGLGTVYSPLEQGYGFKVNEKIPTKLFGKEYRVVSMSSSDNDIAVSELKISNNGEIGRIDQQGNKIEIPRTIEFALTLSFKNHNGYYIKTTANISPYELREAPNSVTFEAGNNSGEPVFASDWHSTVSKKTFLK